MLIKIGVIGPTNLQKLTKITLKPINFFLERARKIGKILAESGIELWINSDKGMLVGVARGYKKITAKN